MATVVEQLPQTQRSRGFRADGDARSRRSQVARLVEREVIPRLLAASAVAHGPLPIETREEPVATRDIGDVAALACQADAAGFFDRIDALAETRAPEALFVELFAPAARLLGQWWEEDERDFTAVTIGLWRLQEAVRAVAARTPPLAWPGEGASRALFSAMPGDQHGFGAVLVSETFARAGWDVDLATGESASELIGRVARGSFDLVGLTVTLDRDSAALPSLIQSMRAVSHHSALRVMVGGRIFVADPALAMQLGADGTAADAESALAVAADLVERAAGASMSLY